MLRHAEILVVALMLTTVLAPASASAKKARPPVVAVWNLAEAEAEGAEAAHWRTRIAAAISDLSTMDADGNRSFPPTLRRSEGIEVAITVANRRVEAAWRAHWGKDPDAALLLLVEAEGQIEGLPAWRLPSGFRRDMALLRARIELGRGDVEAAKAALRVAVRLDPSWTPRHDGEFPAFLRLIDAVLDEATIGPRAKVALASSIPGVRLLVEGVDRGTLAGTGAIDLPMGSWEICGRKAGYADQCEPIDLHLGDVASILFNPKVENSLAFQSELAVALADPASQRGAPVWEGLRLATRQIDARAVLATRFDPDPSARRGGALLIGLFLPGRAGWAFYRKLELHSDLGRDQLLVERTIEDLLVTLSAWTVPERIALRSP